MGGARAAAYGVVVTSHDVSLPDGRLLRVWEYGDPDGPVVVVHHGTPGAGGMFVPESATARDAAARGLRLLAADRAGYGTSHRHAGRVVADVAADTAAMCDALGVDRFHTWGLSGGGPHALACAALLPDRVISAASLAGVAPYDAEGLDWTDGMGQDNLDEFELSLRGEAALRPALEEGREAMSHDVEDIIAAIPTLLPPADVAALRGSVGPEILASDRIGLEHGVDGWLDDDLAFVAPWGFDPGSIAVPLLIWQGGADKMVPQGHGRWLIDHVPHTEAWQDPEEGHLSLLAGTPRVHEWLLSHG